MIENRNTKECEQIEGTNCKNSEARREKKRYQTGKSRLGLDEVNHTKKAEVTQGEETARDQSAMIPSGRVIRVLLVTLRIRPLSS